MKLKKLRIPNMNKVVKTTLNQCKNFVLKAGRIILLMSIALWLLASFSPQDESFFQSRLVETPELSESSIRLEYSYIGYIGKSIEPLIRPLGYDWKIGISLITSIAAREVFVASTSTLYSIGSEEENTIVQRLEQEINPLTGKRRYDVATGISLILFYMFALQCMSTIAVMWQETKSWKWPLIQFFVSGGIAYLSAFLAYHFLS